MNSPTHSKQKHKLLGNHQRSWLWGRNLLLELLGAGRWLPLELYLDRQLDPEIFGRAVDLADQRRVPVSVAERKRLTELCHQDDHQGFLALMPEFPYAGLPQLLAGEAGRPRLIALLDRIQDAYNFGAILRSAEALGVTGVVIGSQSQCGVNSLAARASAGAVCRVPVARVDDLVAACGELKAAGLRIAGANEKQGVNCGDFDFRRDTALIIGNENNGVAPELLAVCDGELRIPQGGAIGSLNAAMAAAILFYEAARQRTNK